MKNAWREINSTQYEKQLKNANKESVCVNVRVQSIKAQSAEYEIIRYEYE